MAGSGNGDGLVGDTMDGRAIGFIARRSSRRGTRSKMAVALGHGPWRRGGKELRRLDAIWWHGREKDQAHEAHMGQRLVAQEIAASRCGRQRERERERERQGAESQGGSSAGNIHRFVSRQYPPVE